MSDFFDKLAELHDRIEQERGPFQVFGLFEREEAPGRWDLLVAAPWMTDHQLESVRFLFSTIRDHLGREEWPSIEHIVAMDLQDRFLDGLKAIRARDGSVSFLGTVDIQGHVTAGDRYAEIKDCVLNGVPFRRVILYTFDPERSAPGRRAVIASAAVSQG